jgi:hypothetical protein
MPGLNRRGPSGEGAMTGRKLGRCQPENKGAAEEAIMQSRETQNPMWMQRRQGRGCGKGFGKGHGHRNNHN